MFLGILTLILLWFHSFWTENWASQYHRDWNSDSDLYLFSRNSWRNQCLLCKNPIWDTILHTTNGFLMAAIQFALIDLFNRSDRFSIKMSPYFVAFLHSVFQWLLVLCGNSLNSAWTGFLEWICRRTGSYRPSTLWSWILPVQMFRSM